MRVLFVCTGNTCRSPMAEILFNSVCTETMSAFSRGTSVWGDLPASANSIFAMKEMGLGLDGHCSNPLRKEDIDACDIVLCMTENHRKFICEKYPHAADKAHLIYDFAEGKNRDVHDPHGGSLNDYRNCARELNLLVFKTIDKLKMV